MVCLIRKRSKIYKRLRRDIWGKFGQKFQRNELSWLVRDKVFRYWMQVKGIFNAYRSFKRERYVFKLWGRRKFTFPNRLTKNYLIPRLLRNYYMIIDRTMFIKKIKKAFKGYGLYIERFLMSLEGRLYTIMYRTNWVTNLFIIKELIGYKLVSVNGMSIKYSNYIVKIGDFIQINPYWIVIFREDLRIRLDLGYIMTPPLASLFINYFFMYCFFTRMPKKKDIYYPIGIDIFRAFDFIGPWR